MSLSTVLRRPPHLKHVLSFAVSVLACGLIALVTITIGGAGMRRLEHEIGASMRLLADQMQDKLDRALFERYREMGASARLLTRLGIAADPDRLRAWLAEMHASYSEYAWLAVVDAKGKVARATGGILEGVDVSDQPWFESSTRETTVSDVARFERLASQLPRRPDAPQFVAVAAPVLDAAGERVGALVGLLDWHWAEEVRDSLFGSRPQARSADVMVLSATGVSLLGPPGVSGSTLQLDSVKDAMSGVSKFAREVWPDGKSYVTGFARSDGHRTFSGLGWLVLVRQPSEIALGPVYRLHRQTLLWSALLVSLALAAAWLLSGRIAAPLLLLAKSADGLRRGEATDIPHFNDYAEAETLSGSLDALLSELDRRRRALVALNRSLEAQVAERTRELTRQNEALSLAHAAAEEATASKSRFLAAASHDLRQPLHAMTLFARALARRVTGEEAQSLVGQLETSLVSLREMFEALLNISRLDAGLLRPQLSPVSVAEIMQRIAAGVAAEAGARGLSCRLRPLDAVVVTDPALLETMLRNLVSNALKFTSSGGILLAARRIGGRVAIEVWDTGRGIPEERQRTVFDEFERSTDQVDGTNEGLGLGLSIVRRYAALLGIDVSLASRPGRGSCFRLLFPVADAVASRRDPAAPQPRTASPPAPPPGTRILIVDDDPQIVAAMARDLADRNCIPLPFSSPVAAEEAAAAGLSWDAAVVDFTLGGGQTGPALLQKLERTLGRGLNALILTGGTDAATMKSVLASGRPWLTKPAEPDDISAALARLLHPGGAYVGAGAHPWPDRVESGSVTDDRSSEAENLGGRRS